MGFNNLKSPAIDARRRILNDDVKDNVSKNPAAKVGKFITLKKRELPEGEEPDV